MAKRRVYNLDNLHECFKYLEDSDDSVTDATWIPSPKKKSKRDIQTEKCVKNLEPNNSERSCIENLNISKQKEVQIQDNQQEKELGTCDNLPVLLSVVPPVTNLPLDSAPATPSPSKKSPVLHSVISPTLPCKNSLVSPPAVSTIALSMPDLTPVAAIACDYSPAAHLSLDIALATPLLCENVPVLPSAAPPVVCSPPGSALEAPTAFENQLVLHHDSPSPTISPSIIQPQSGYSLQVKQRSRKRLKYIGTWKKNIRKRRRNEGKEYVSNKSKTIPAKVIEAYNHICRYECNTFTEEDRKQIHSEYWKLGDWEAQTNFIRYCVRIEKPKRTINKKKKSTIITLNTKRVCKDFFLKTLTISNRRFTNAAFTKTPIQGIPLTDKRGKHEPGNKTKEEKLNEVRGHINSFPKFKSHYSREDAPLKIYLSPELSVSKMYSLYKKKMIEEEKQQVSEQIYRKVFNSEFNLGFYKLRSDTCNTCDNLENLYKCEQNGEKKESIKEEKEKHLKEVERTREAKRKDKEDEDVHMITFDLEKTLPTPYLQTNLVYYKRLFWTYNLGIHDCKTRNAHMYMWGENIASRGASEVASCLLKYITNVVPNNCDHLVAYSDSCGGQNRNQIICRLWMYVVAHTSITTVDHKFMVSGHSYLENDDDFSHIEKKKKKSEYIYVPDDWMTLIEKTRKKFTVHRMQQDDFVFTDPVSKAIVNRKIDTSKNKANWLKIRWMRFLKEQPKSMFFKETLDADTPFRQINMDAKKGDIPKRLPKLGESQIKLKHAKIKDLTDLLKFIPSIHHEFYNSLICEENQPSTSTKRSRGRPRKVNEQETDEESILDYDHDE